MPVDDRKRQQKLMKKRQKDNERKKKEARQKTSDAERFSVTRKVLASSHWPFYECYISESWRRGFARVIVSRRQPDARITFAAFMVDLQCLGVKDAFCNANLSPTEFRTKLLDHPDARLDPVIRCTPQLAQAVIYGAIDFAADFGFLPHKDFDFAQNVLDPPESVPPHEGVDFGHDGKPLFVSGEYDDADRVLDQLRRTAGEGNFNYIVPVDPATVDLDKVEFGDEARTRGVIRE